jgi:hypothetical protein
LFLGGPLIAAIAAKIIRMRFADDIADRAWCEFSTGGALKGSHARTSISEDCPLVTVHINRLSLEVFDDRGAINDRRVVDNEIATAVEMIVETMDVAERKE